MSLNPNTYIGCNVKIDGLNKNIDVMRAISQGGNKFVIEQMSR